MRKNLSSALSVLAASLILLTFSGCKRRVVDETFPSPPPEPSSRSEAESSSSEPVPPEEPFKDIVFSDVPEIPGSAEVSFPWEIFSPHFFWVDSTHIYMFPEQCGGDGVMIDIENGSLEPAPGYSLSYGWDNIFYQDDVVLLAYSDFYLKFDKKMNLLSKDVLSPPEPHDDIYYFSSFHLPSETLYYIEQDDPENPVLWSHKEDKTEIAAELPPLREGESYDNFKISPSGDKLFLCRIYNGLRTNCIFFLDMKSKEIISATTRPGWENYPAGFFQPVGVWMGEQPIFFVDHEYSGRVQALEGFNSVEMMYGIPLESRQKFFTAW